MDVADLDADPIVEFGRWHAAAGTDAVTLATAAPDGQPSARVVLIKQVDQRGFVFQTNEHSAKGREMLANPRAALVFHYPPDRQVRVTGPVEPIAAAESDAYWRTRPRGSQLGAWASEQSAVIADRSALERRLAEVSARFEDGVEVPRPPHWGGFRVTPLAIEFWHHQDDRLHDRIRFRRDHPGQPWVVERLSP